MKMNTLAVSEKANEKGEKERWRDSRHLSGQRPAVVQETSDMKMRAAQPPADLSHRGRGVHPIPHSMKSPSHSISLAESSSCPIVAFCSMSLSLSLSLFYKFPSPLLFFFVRR